jgi:hypothetical protein
MTTTTIIEHHQEELTPEEEDLYFEAFCFYCGKRLEVSEFNNHLCAAKQELGSYYKEDSEDFN